VEFDQFRACIQNAKIGESYITVYNLLKSPILQEILAYEGPTPRAMGFKICKLFTLLQDTLLA